MANDTARKICPMCCSEIPEKARKCPHCHHFQNRAALLLFSPAFAAVWVLIPLLAFALVLATFFDEGEKFETFKDQITITQSQLTFGETKNANTVVVLGEVENHSAIDWKEVSFQVQFFDSAGKLIDTGQKLPYPFSVPAKAKIPFKISMTREFPKEQYAKHSVTITSAKDERSRW